MGKRAFLGVLAVTAAVLTIGGCGAAGSPGPSTSGPSTSGSATASPSIASSSPASTPSVSPTPALRIGDHGPQVLAVQHRLVELGFWLGTPDGTYGSSTHHAVTAYQKANGLPRDGVAGPATRAAMTRTDRPTPRSDSGRIAEIDLARQVLILAVDGRTQWIIDISTGAEAGTTPRGHFTVYRQVDGYDHGPLGVLYRPKYVAGGVAVHGYPNVPPYPASHGCIRVTNAVMDWLWSSRSLPIGHPVWIY